MSHMFILHELHKPLDPKIKTNILQYTRLYMDMIEAMILFGQRSVVDSLIKGFECHATIYPSYYGWRGLFGPCQWSNNG